MTEPTKQTPITVEIMLSHPTYRLGGTVVGSIRVTHNSNINDAASVGLMGSHRTKIDSLQLSAAGFCRLDPRWHATTTDQIGNSDRTLILPPDLPLPPHTTCFWTAGGPIELMELQERTFGRWEDVRPKAIILPGRTAQENKANLRVAALSHDDSVNLEERQLAFSFRVDLPAREAPHSLVATSCRYYYLIMVRLQTNRSIGDDEPEWIQLPVTVLTGDPSQCYGDDDASIAIRPPLQAVAHSSGLPAQLTSTELNQFEGQYTVCRQGAELYRNLRGVQSMRVEDPASGRPACLLTILGSPSQLHPGSRLTLKLDFPRLVPGEEAAWIPCYSASACLQGEEVAICLSKSKRKRARRHLFSTAHEQIDHTTECVPLSLMLPETAPCTVKTSAVEITVQCIIDIAVGTTKGDGFRNLRLEIPCQVLHAMSDWERKDEDEETPGVRTFQEIFQSRLEQSSDPSDPRSFRSADIQSELKILSLHMADTCGLRPKPSDH